MIVRSRTGALFAAALAIAAHGAAIWVLAPDQDVEMEGGAGAAVARLGSGFADFVEGAAAPVTPTETAQTAPPPPEPQQPVTPQPTQVAPAEPVTPPPQSTATASPVVSAAPSPNAPSVAIPVAPTPPAQAEHSQPETTAARAPTEEVEAMDEIETSVVLSPRPPERPKSVEERAEAQRAEARPEPQRQRTQNRGNATRTTTAGAATGSQTATATRQGTAAGTRSAASGNAAANNYPGEVLRRISRVRKPRVGTRGTALIAFSISGSGGLSAVSVARSSGSATLDQAALRVIRMAAPFPPPPSGARRQFSIRIEGR